MEIRKSPLTNYTKLEELADTVKASVATINGHLQSQDMPEPSFDPDAAMSLPDEVSAAQDSALDAVTELYDLLISPLHAMVLGSVCIMFTPYVPRHLML
jgi:hypothetical protein